MPSLDWTAFHSLPGSKNQNFENLCRALIRLHFGQYGKFASLKNQPGVEFHLKLSGNCPTLGGPPRWYGWQCKLHERTITGDLRASSRKDIENSLRKTEEHLSGLTDWVLWTPYTLSKKDQKWFNSLQTEFTLHQWVEEDIDTYLSGPGLILRSTYFGEFILTPDELARRHLEAIQPIRERWLAPVHQSVDAERTVRRMLGEPGSWDQMIAVGSRLEKAAKAILDSHDVSSKKIEKAIMPFIEACYAFADTLLHFHQILADGDLDNIQQKLRERKTLIDAQVHAILRQLRASNLRIALDATNALDDMHIAHELLNEIEEFLGVALVAVLADAGGGKTQMAAQLTSPQDDRPAGILLHGRALQKGQTLDDLARHFSINGNPLTSMERLLASLDAAGKRAGCRLPVLIDGLNEAEDPRDWKAPLSTLSETVKPYPNVLVVCTLRTGEHRRDRKMWGMQPPTSTRESFAFMALPDGVKRIESEGFGGDVDEAISKYFSYFKINAKDAEIPVEFLQHPLNLRIFCEVTNSKRGTIINVDYVPASLTLLFEKYVLNVCERIAQMTNLSYRFNADDVASAIYKFGLQLWESKKRWVDETIFRAEVSDNNRLWDSSVVNLLSQEGIIFRNPGTEPGVYIITPVYDALGGYIVADSLLTKYASDVNFDWLKKPEVIKSFAGDDSHPMAFDIFNSLVALAPHRMHGRQLWKKAPDIFSKAALRFTTVLEAKYLDQETVAALMALFKDDPKERTRLFSRLKGTRGVPNHPLNSEFQDSALRTLSVSERDLSWTEWIRETRTERFNELLSMELRWKNDIVTRSLPDRLRAKWVMWLLTSTDHEFRDVATRALYWFGRGDPAALFEECLSSLEINDPYVPERMIAASYGVAMAFHVNLEDHAFVNTILPGYARKLFDLLFAESAPYSTTHILLREFATRTIELAVFHNPNLFSHEEVERSKPPFSDGGLRDWGQSENLKEGRLGHDSPFRMDFENYSLGSLVPGRGNYDYNHEEYQKVRAQVLWRVEQLGWSSELFSEIDRSIASGQHWARTASDKHKMDRYGKKYSWIAYYEMSGLLHDQGVLEYWRERTSSVDIDPSFPERVTKGHIIKSDILGDPEMEMKEWIKNGLLPNISPYLRLEKVLEKEGPWIALDGYITQQDEKRGRKSFCFIRSFLVSNQDAASFTDHLSRQDLGGRWLPEKPEVIYIFAGEISWCDCFHKNDLSKFSFVTGEKAVMVQRTQYEYYLDGKQLDLDELDFKLIHLPANRSASGGKDEQHRWVIIQNIGDKDEHQNINEEDIERIEVREMQVEAEEVRKEYKNYNALIPVCDFSWEGYQTAASDAGHAVTLAKEIAINLELIGQPQTFDLFTKDGLQATFNISDQSGDYNNHQSMFYVKEDLLIKYLKKNELSLIWAMWGEREYSSDQVDKLFHGPDHPEQPYAVFSFVKHYEHQ
jgi:hypothetical protein